MPHPQTCFLVLSATLLLQSCATSDKEISAAQESSAAQPAASRAPATDPAAEATLLTRIRQLTIDGRRAGEGYFSPDGNRLVFQSEREPENPFYQIYELDLTTGETRRVSPGSGKTTCAFINPKTGDVLFASTHLDANSAGLQQAELDFRASGKERRYSWDYDPEFELFVSDAATGQLNQLTNVRGYDAEASYSPDGSLIVFCSTRDAYLSSLSSEEQQWLDMNPSIYGEIYLMNSDGSNQRRLTQVLGYDGGPFFSPDGSKILWRRFDEEGMIADIWTMNIDGTGAKQVTDFGAMSWAPYYHPSGKYILFASNKLGFANFEVYMVDQEGTREPVRVTYSDGFDGLPVPSPNGERLAWTSNRGNRGSQIFIANWNHEAAMAALGQAPQRILQSQPPVK